jgi:DNA replication licensing factor MCM7
MAARKQMSKPPNQRSYSGFGQARKTTQLQSGFKGRILPDYLTETRKCACFLENFMESEFDEEPKYIKQLKAIIERKAKQIVIEVDDLNKYSETIIDEKERTEWFTLLRNIQKNALRYISLFSNAVDGLLENITPSASVPEYDVGDVIDVLRMHRESRTQVPNTNLAINLGQAGSALTNPFPKSLSRRYELRIVPSKEAPVVPMRKVRAKQIGSLVKLKGVVTRVTEVKPLIVVATYTCDRCGWEIYQEVNARQFMPLLQCTSEVCKANQVKGKLQMQTRGSKFIKFQEVRIQEISEEVPMGHIPCSLVVHVRGELTRQCSPGDVAVVSGIFLPTPNTGFRALVAGLIGDTYMEAMDICQQKKSYANYSITPKIHRQIARFARNPQAYALLAKSLAPEIYGHEDIKKALVLLMVGGVTRTLDDGMKIRGDINICLMGDPGVAKSQLLKHIATISPRGIYTSGKGSSGVGLTAAVVKDSTTNELVLGTSPPYVPFSLSIAFSLPYSLYFLFTFSEIYGCRRLM